MLIRSFNSTLRARASSLFLYFLPHSYFQVISIISRQLVLRFPMQIFFVRSTWRCARRDVFFFFFFFVSPCFLRAAAIKKTSWFLRSYFVGDKCWCHRLSSAGHVFPTSSLRFFFWSRHSRAAVLPTILVPQRRHWNSQTSPVSVRKSPIEESQILSRKFTFKVSHVIFFQTSKYLEEDKFQTGFLTADSKHVAEFIFFVRYTWDIVYISSTI